MSATAAVPGSGVDSPSRPLQPSIRLVVAALMLASFGPYVDRGLRTEQIGDYGAALLALALLPQALHTLRPLIFVLHAWVLYAGVTVLGAVSPPGNTTSWVAGSVAAGIDNVLLPLAVILVGIALTSRADPVALLRELCGWTVVLMVLNTVAAILQSRGIRDWSAWWTSPKGDTFSVAANAATNGRYSGLINQPAEAGFLCGVAMLAALYLWSARPRILLVALSVTTYGAFLTVSKIFLLVAIPLVVWQLLRLPEARLGRALAAVVGVVSGYLVVRAGWVPGTVGDQLTQVVPRGDESVVTAVTASRLGESSTLWPVVQQVWSDSPLSGMGAAGLLTPYDNGFVEAFVLAGSIGAVCYTATLWLFTRMWWRMPESKERTLLGSLVVLAVGGSMGVPVLTANRVATVLWLLLTVLAVVAHQRTRSAANPRPLVVPADR